MFSNKAAAEIQALRLKREQAHALLESLPGFAEAMVKLHEVLEFLRIQPLDQFPIRSNERMNHALRILEAQADAYLPLVTDMNSHRAFVVMVQQFCDWAWTFYNGLPNTDFRPPIPTIGPLSEQAELIAKRFRHWTAEGYRHVAQHKSNLPDTPWDKTVKRVEEPITPVSGRHVWPPMSQTVHRDPISAETVQAAAAATTAPKPSKSRRTFREPNAELLKNPDATLNRKNAAQALGVSERTLDRWVTDKKLTPIGPGLRKRFKVRDLIRILNQKNRDKVDKDRQE